MSQVTITLPDGSVRSVPAGTPVRGVAEESSPNLAKAALAGIVDGTLVALADPLQQHAALRRCTDRLAERVGLGRPTPPSRPDRPAAPHTPDDSS